MNDFRADVPFQHPFYNDWEFYIAPDQQYTSLLAPTNTGKDPNTGLIVDATYNRVTTTAAARGLAVPQGVLGVETDQGLVPPEYRALDGDRVVVLGRWIVDCGHPEFHTENLSAASACGGAPNRQRNIRKGDRPPVPGQPGFR